MRHDDFHTCLVYMCGIIPSLISAPPSGYLGTCAPVLTICPKEGERNLKICIFILDGLASRVIFWRHILGCSVVCIGSLNTADLPPSSSSSSLLLHLLSDIFSS